MSLYTKTIAPCDGGVSHAKKPYIIDPTQWVTLAQLRCKEGIVQNFPGWASALAAGTVGAYGTFAAEFAMTDGDVRYIVGGPANLYRVTALGALVDVSGISPLAATKDDPWVGFSYKDAQYITNKLGGMFKYTKPSDLFTLLPDPPWARACHVLNDHLCVLNTLVDSQEFGWAAEASETDWVASSSNDAGAFSLSGTPGVGVVLVPFGIDLIAYKTDEIVDLAFVGGNEVFGIRDRNQTTGLLGPNAVANVGDYHEGFGTRSIFRYSGGKQVDDAWALPVRSLVYDGLHVTWRNRAVAFYWPDSRETIFAYPSLQSTGDCDTCVVWNRDEQKWYGPFAFPISAFAGPAKDDALFVDPTGDVVRLGTGQSAKAVAVTRTAESGDHFLGDGAVSIAHHVAVAFPLGSIFMVTMVNVEYEPTAGIAYLQLGSRMSLSDPLVYTPLVPINLAGGSSKLGVRATGRWFRVKITVPQSNVLNLGGYQYEFSPVGRQ